MKILRNINFTPHLANRNIRYKISNKYARVLFDMYQPIAKFRFEHNFYHLPIEMYIEKHVLKILDS